MLWIDDDPRDDDFAPLATMSEAHLEWHANTGVPLGTPGCPQDACHADEYDDDDEASLAYSPGRFEDAPHADFLPDDDDIPF